MSSSFYFIAERTWCCALNSNHPSIHPFPVPLPFPDHPQYNRHSVAVAWSVPALSVSHSEQKRERERFRVSSLTYLFARRIHWDIPGALNLPSISVPEYLRLGCESSINLILNCIYRETGTFLSWHWAVSGDLNQSHHPPRVLLIWG